MTQQQALGRRLAEGRDDRREVHTLTLVAREVFRRQIDLARRDLQALFGVAEGPDRERQHGLAAVAVLECQAGTAGRSAERDAEHGRPLSVVLHHHHGHSVQARTR